MADDRQVNEVIINGETVVNLRKDTVAENNLMEEETATNHEGRKIEGEFNGASEDDAYLVSDPIGDIEEEDYVPFNDVSDTEVPKKKTLFSELIEKLKNYFMSALSPSGNSEIKLTNDTVEIKNNSIDASKVDNNVTSIRYPSTSVILDKDGRCIMRTEVVVNPNGEIGWKSYVRNYDTDGNMVAQKGMLYHMNKSGNLRYLVDDARAFRKAIDSIDQLGTSLPRNTVIDDYHTDSYTGTYYFADDGVASTIVTLPEALCGKLIVMNSGNGGFIQFYIPNHSVKLWMRVWWSNAWSAWQNLASGSKPHTYETDTEIPANANLNTYTTAGVYQCNLTATARTMSNLPYTGNDRLAFKLIVMKIRNSNNLIQWYIPYDNLYTWVGSKIAYRTTDDDGSSWRDWVIVARYHDIVHQYLGTTIPDNSNLNDYTTNGIYNVSTNSSAETISNMPYQRAGKLVVMRIAGNQYIKQFYIPYGQNDNARIASRSVDASASSPVWSLWSGLTEQTLLDNGNVYVLLSTKTTTEQDYHVGIKARIEETTTGQIYAREVLKIFQDHQANSYGFNLLLEGGGNTVIGSGEAASSLYPILNKTKEDLHLISDANLNIISKANTISERVGIRLDTNGRIVPIDANGLADNLIDLGWETAKYANLWVYKINGSVPPTSDELNTAIAKVGKSILPSWSYASNVRTSNGVTFTFNPTTGEITVNGTATADTTNIIAGVGLSQYTIPKGTYTLSGCPSGGDSNKYGLTLNLVNMNQVDYGSGVTFTLTSEHVCDDNQHLYIFVKSGVTVSNLVFRPMLRPAYTSDTYEPCEDIHKGNCYVGTCETAAGTKDKVAYVDGYFILRKGVRVAIKFSNTNTYSSTTSSPVTLNVNDTGAKNIYYNNTHSGAGNTGTNTRIYGIANRYVFYIYDGTYWVWDSHSCDDNSTNFLRNDASSTLTASTPYINLKASNVDEKQSNNGVTSSVYPAYIIQDKNGYNIGRLETCVNPNGETSLYLMVGNYNTTSGSTFHGGIKIYSNKSQDMWYSLTNPHYFARAMGIGYGTCSTDADQRVKVVSMPRFVLCTGAIIGVKFTNTNTYSATEDNKVCLNVNGTGEKPIYYNTGYSTGTNTTAFGIANRVHYYMYDGTNWCWLNSGCEDNTVDPRQLGSGYGTCDTAAATAAKVVTMSNYTLRTGGILSVKFTNAVPANATMNINSRGAKNIWYRGANITANVIQAGDLVTFVYDGTRYQILSNDRWGL